MHIFSKVASVALCNHFSLSLPTVPSPHCTLTPLHSHCHCALIVTVPSLSLCPHYHCALIITVPSLSLCPHYHCALIIIVPSLSLCPHYHCALIIIVPSLSLCSHYHCALNQRGQPGQIASPPPTRAQAARAGGQQSM